ncbi:MAG: hypothetical protein ABWW69_05690 [Pyrodictiaceae archaeon]
MNKSASIILAYLMILVFSLYALKPMLIAANGLSTPRAISISLGLLAITDDKGEIIGAGIRITPGKGEVMVEPSELVAKDTRLSLAVASYYGLMMAGLNPLSFDVLISLNTSRSVKGPSASGLVALAVYMLASRMLIAHNTTRLNYSMTGFLSPSGIILPVEGVCQKVSAGLKQYNSILVPAFERLNCGTLLDAFHILKTCSIPLGAMMLATHKTGFQQLSPRSIYPEAFSRYQESFSSIAKKLISVAKRLKTLLPAVNETIEHLLVESQEAYKHGEYYAAASLAYYYIHVILDRIASYKGGQNLLKARSLIMEELGYRDINELRNNVSSFLLKESNYLTSANLINLWNLDILAESYKRLHEAQQLLDSNDTLRSTYGVLRLYAALGWMMLIKNTVEGPLISRGALIDKMKALIKYSEFWMKLLNTISIGLTNITTGLEDKLEEAAMELSRNNILKAYTGIEFVLERIEQLTSLAPIYEYYDKAYVLRCLKDTVAAYTMLLPSGVMPSMYLLSGYIEAYGHLLGYFADIELLLTLISKAFITHFLSSPSMAWSFRYEESGFKANVTFFLLSYILVLAGMVITLSAVLVTRRDKV